MTGIGGYLGGILQLMGDQPSLPRMLLENGRAWGPVTECPARWLGSPRQCYRNSALYAMADKTVAYCEGYAVHRDTGLPVSHAWVVNNAGAVIDPTWETGLEYWGLAFRRSFLSRQLLHSEVYGILEDMWTVKRLVLEPKVRSRAFAARVMKRGLAAATP